MEYIQNLNFKQVINKHDTRFIFPAHPMGCPAVGARSALRRGTQRGLQAGEGEIDVLGSFFPLE